MLTPFRAVPIGAAFLCNGNRCVKQSTRTAVLTAYGRVFYFGANELVRLI